MIANNCIHYRCDLNSEWCRKRRYIVSSPHVFMCDDCQDYKKSKNRVVGNYDGNSDQFDYVSDETINRTIDEAKEECDE